MFAKLLKVVSVAALAVLSGVTATPALAGTVSSDLIPIGSGTQWAALSPDGTMMATSNRGTNNVTIINLADNSTQTVSVGSYDVNNLQGIVFSADSSTIYVANYGSTFDVGTMQIVDSTDGVLVIDVQSATAIDLLTYANADWDTLAAVAMSPDGTKLYVSNAVNGRLYAYDLANDFVVWAPVQSSVTSSYTLFVAPDGETVYNVDWYGHVDVSQTSDGAIIDTWTTSATDVDNGCASPDFTSLVLPQYSDSPGGGYTLVSTIDGSTIDTVSGDMNEPGFCTFSADGQYVFISAIGSEAPGQVYQYEVATGDLVQVYDVADGPGQPLVVGDCTIYVATSVGTVNIIEDTCPVNTPLASTGFDAQSMTMAGLAVAAAGLVAVVAVRRRQRV